MSRKKKKKKSKRQSIPESMIPKQAQDDDAEDALEQAEIRQRPPTKPRPKGLRFHLQRWLGIAGLSEYLNGRVLPRVEDLHQKIDHQLSLTGQVKEQGHQYEKRHEETMTILREHTVVLNEVLEEIAGLRAEISQAPMSAGGGRFPAQAPTDTFDRDAPFDLDEPVSLEGTGTTPLGDTDDFWDQNPTPRHQKHGVGGSQRSARTAATSRRKTPRKESEEGLKELARGLQPWIKQLSLSNPDLGPIVSEMAEQLGTDVEQLPLGGTSSDDWEVMILRPRSWSRGLAVAGPGVQVDSDTVRLFDAEFGMRVKSCLEPAIVLVENDNKYDVKQKGKVKTER